MLFGRPKSKILGACVGAWAGWGNDTFFFFPLPNHQMARKILREARPPTCPSEAEGEGGRRDACPTVVRAKRGRRWKQQDKKLELITNNTTTTRRSPPPTAGRRRAIQSLANTRLGS